MSSGSYAPKPFEEISAKVELFIENYEKLTGKKLNKDQLLVKIKTLSEQKEAELFNQTFGTLHPKNLKDCETILLHIGECQNDTTTGSGKTIHNQKHGKQRN